MAWNLTVVVYEKGFDEITNETIDNTDSSPADICESLQAQF
jgi:hypothetical protein